VLPDEYNLRPFPLVDFYSFGSSFMSMLNRSVTYKVIQPFFVIAYIAALLASASVSSGQSISTNIKAETSTTESATTSERVINCSSGFASSGACGVADTGGGGQPFQLTGAFDTGSLSGSQVNIIQTGTTHKGSGLIYQTPVNVQAFSTTFTFIPNGSNFAFVLQNNTSSSGNGGRGFVAGAGCEAGFFQAFNTAPVTPPNNILALELDSYSPIANDNNLGVPFTYSSVQIFTAGQSPCNPNDNGPDYTFIQKVSTFPVPLNSPANGQGTITGDTYSVTLGYNGTTLTMSMYDVTIAGPTFTQRWPVNIPSLVGGNTAYVGFTGGVGEASASPLSVGSLVYNVGASPAAATPTFSVPAGTYTAVQTVSISDATSGATIHYTTDGTTPTTSSTEYTGPIAVDSTETLEAVAVVGDPTTSAVARATYVIGSPYISYPRGGFKASSFNLNGGAAITSGGLLQLTDGGGDQGRSAWFAAKVPVQTFTTDFTFQLTDAEADGFAFVIQNAGSTALGADGGGLGYWGIPHSLAIKFDLYNNEGEGLDSTGLFTQGASPTVPAVGLTGTPINLHSGDPFAAHITYDGANLTLTLTDSSTLGIWSHSWPINIAATVGGNTAYVGFTGSTGGATSTQKVLSWTLSNP
jgi:Legume lectin domain/Chitobiase/beta-hexosaminidase C-terminal domain